MVAVCVTTDDDVRTVTLGADGLLAAMAPGSSLAVHSTVHPDTVAAVHAAGAAAGVSVLDAPVSGGNAGARAGTMAVLLGGEPDVIERWRPVFATFATTVEVLGGIGAGQRAKLVNNALSAVTLAASLDALQAAEELGLDRDAAYRVMRASSGDSFMLRRAPMIDDHGAGLAAARLRKDLSLLQELARPEQSHASTLAATADRAVTGLEARAAGA
jgi:3-hydroxyisobutyrate dehydrogenase-like beta-hydroxyacid dehydrogenase